VSETLESIAKADAACVDGHLQRSLEATAGNGSARDAIEFDGVRCTASDAPKLLPTFSFSSVLRSASAHGMLPMRHADGRCCARPASAPGSLPMRPQSPTRPYQAVPRPRAQVDVVSPTGRLLAAALSFRVARGASLLVTGPNGAGKSSVFRILGGLWPLACGRVRLPGGNEHLDTKDVFYVPQRPYTTIGALREQARALARPPPMAGLSELPVGWRPRIRAPCPLQALSNKAPLRPLWSALPGRPPPRLSDVTRSMRTRCWRPLFARGRGSSVGEQSRFDLTCL